MIEKKCERKTSLNAIKIICKILQRDRENRETLRFKNITDIYLYISYQTLFQKRGAL
jgi:hypothetical protein